MSNISKKAHFMKGRWFYDIVSKGNKQIDAIPVKEKSTYKVKSVQSLVSVKADSGCNSLNWYLDDKF